MATPADLRSAAEAYSTQADITAAAIVAARSVRPQTPEKIATVIAAYQLIAAQAAANAVPGILEEQGISSAAAASVAASALAGYSSAGYPLASSFAALTSASQLAMLVASTVQDAGRNGASLAMATSLSATGYVRMLNPPSCSRCAILAGKWFKWNQGFERHPQCDCRHIPANESTAGDLTTDPREYFDSLPSNAEVEDQYPDTTRRMRNEAGIYSREDIFGVAGARAILDGADMNQVVNARRGMAKAQLFGREVWHTFEGVTRRSAWRKEQPKTKVPVRLMPETIYAVATDREDALRLLKLYGFIF